MAYLFIGTNTQVSCMCAIKGRILTWIHSRWFFLAGPMDYSNRMMTPDPSPHTSSLGMLPVHPDVKLKHLPFYDCITELMKPTSLGNEDRIIRYISHQYAFDKTNIGKKSWLCQK